MESSDILPRLAGTISVVSLAILRATDFELVYLQAQIQGLGGYEIFQRA
jgi:hypothetical protein